MSNSYFVKYLRILHDYASSLNRNRRNRRYFFKFQNEFKTLIYSNGCITVLSGPFCGMKYYNKIVWGPITPKWLGTYECELHDIVDYMIKRKYSKILDIGAAEGYYAVGLAYMSPESHVISYDVDYIARKRLLELKQLNDVSNIEIKGYCDYDEITAQLCKNALIVCDIEGCEYDLLRPDKCQALAGYDLLVEIHSFQDKSVSDVEQSIIQRFCATHEIQVLSISQRDITSIASQIPTLRNISKSIVERAVDECRWMPQVWLFMKRRDI